MACARSGAVSYTHLDVYKRQEKARAKVGLTFEEATGVKRHLIDWALGVGRRVAEAKAEDRALWPPLAVQHAVADKLVLSKVRERFGGRVRFFISGSAPLDPEVGWWFASMGLLIIEGYGLTETAAATCVNRPYDCLLYTSRCV